MIVAANRIDEERIIGDIAHARVATQHARVSYRGSTPDDLGAIIIIAVFYSADLSTNALLVAVMCLAALGLMNWRGVGAVSPYVAIGIIMWIAVLKSGVHAISPGSRLRCRKT